jgi:hypothetical protein
MLIKSCFNCEFHKIKRGENEQMSYCRRENCFSRYSKCVAIKALDKFLEEGSSKRDRHFSALTHVYPVVE